MKIRSFYTKLNSNPHRVDGRSYEGFATFKTLGEALNNAEMYNPYDIVSTGHKTMVYSDTYEIEIRQL